MVERSYLRTSVNDTNVKVAKVTATIPRMLPPMQGRVKVSHVLRIAE